MKRHMFRAGVAAVAAASVVTLAACTGDPGPIVTETPWPDASDSPPASPSPTLSPSLAPLTDAELLALMPPDAAYPDIRGAIATARFFLEEFNRVYLTGNLRVWDALSLPDCAFCRSAGEGATELHLAGAYRDGGEMTFDESATVANYYDETGFWYVTLLVAWTPTNDHYPDGSVVPDGDGGTADIAFELEPVDGVWRVRGVEVVERS